MKKVMAGAAVVVLVLVMFAPFAAAQKSFPNGPVTIWVGHAAGGSTDLIVRALAAAAEKSLGQKIVIVNKPGAAGAVCASQVVKEKANGYTLAAFPDPPVTRSPHLTDLDFDPFRDLTFILRVGKWKNVFMVKADSPFKDWKGAVDWARKNPGQLIFGHPGIATAPNFGMIRIAKKEGFTYRNVAFVGDVPVVSALLGGHVMIGGMGAVVGSSHVEAKTMRVLLACEREGLSYAPDAPTLEKMGYDFDYPTDVIIVGPRGLPDSVRETLEKAFVEGMKQETFRKVARENELIGAPLSGKAMVDYLHESNRIYEEAIKGAGLYKSERK